MNSVAFEVTYNDLLNSKKVNEFMSGLGLGITEIKGSKVAIYSWKTSKEINKDYINKAIGVIKKGLEYNGNDVFSVKFVEEKKETFRQRAERLGRQYASVLRRLSRE